MIPFFLGLFILIQCQVWASHSFLPQNNLKIPVSSKNLQGLTEEEFNLTINKILISYTPVVEAIGAKLQIQSDWANATVNAHAQRMGNIFNVVLLGGLARHELMTVDGFTLAICHEVGHHLGGVPRMKPRRGGNNWASVEGQADYWTTLKCLRRVWEKEDNELALLGRVVPTSLKEACAKSWTSAQDLSLCLRSGMAMKAVTDLMATVLKKPLPQFETPDRNVSRIVQDFHPNAQCRLDTLLQGALCPVSYLEDVDWAGEVKGSCHTTLGDTLGTRPLCWFKSSL